MTQAMSSSWHEQRTFGACRCLDAKSSSVAAEVALQHLASADSVSAAYHSINILSTLHQFKTLSQPIEAQHLERIIHLFKSLSDSQGRFKLSSSSPKRSILATGLAYRTLADARLLDIGLSDETEGVVEEIRASLGQASTVCQLLLPFLLCHSLLAMPAYGMLCILQAIPSNQQAPSLAGLLCSLQKFLKQQACISTLNRGSMLMKQPVSCLHAGVEGRQRRRRGACPEWG